MGRLTSFSPWCTKKRCWGGQEALSAKHQVRVLVALHGPARAVGAVQVALWDGWEVKRSVCVSNISSSCDACRSLSPHYTNAPVPRGL